MKRIGKVTPQIYLKTSGQMNAVIIVNAKSVSKSFPAEALHFIFFLFTIETIVETIESGFSILIITFLPESRYIRCIAFIFSIEYARNEVSVKTFQ